MSKPTEDRKQQIWNNILANPGYSRNVNRNNLENIEEEILSQGGCKTVAEFLDKALTTSKQRKAMMEYLISIRQEKVSEFEIIEVANEIMKTI